MDTVKNTSAPGFFDKLWVRYGFAAGFAAIAITVLYYVIDDSLLLHPVLSWLPWVSIALIAVFAPIALKKSQSDYIAYSQAVTTSFGAFGLGLLLMAAFNILLYFIIDPKLLYDFTNAQVKALANLVSSGDISQSSFDVLRRQIVEGANNIYIYQLALVVIITSMAALVMFLISSAILSKEKPHTQI